MEGAGTRLERVVARQLVEDELRQLRSLERSYATRMDSGDDSAAKVLQAVRTMISEREPD